MKKILSIIGAVGLGASAPAPLLANTSITQQSQDKTTDTITIDGVQYQKNKIDNVVHPIGWETRVIIDSNDNIYFNGVDGIYKLSDNSSTPTKIDGTNLARYFAINSKGDIYYSDYFNNFVLKHGETAPTKIDGINDIVDAATGWIYFLGVDNKDNIYFGTSDGLYKLSVGSDTPTKIDGIDKSVNSIVVDSKDNIYFGTDKGVYKLDVGATTPIKIDGITGKINSLVFDNKNNIYYSTGTDVFKLTPIEKPVPPTPSKKLSSIEIAGIAIGSVAGLAFVVLGSCYLYQYLNKKKKANKK